jgi:dipeptidyl aminopeptidase/acylaminoacyl peptidase
MPDNYLIGIALEENTFPISSSSLVVLHEGHDFYACPRISPDGQQIAFVCWDMPDMPWDRTLLYLAPNKGLSQKTATAVVNTAHQAAMQPTWGADNTLYFINDPEGWWQLYKWQDNTPVQVFQVNGEMGLPMWVFGQQSYAILANQQDEMNQAGSLEIVFSYAEQGIWKLGSWSEQSGVTQLSTGASSFDYFVSDSRGTHCYVQCSYPDKSGDIAVLSAEGVTGNIFKASTLPAYAVSKAIPISIPVAGETNADKTTHAFFYPPSNDAYQAPENSLPPLIVIGHGGPSGQSTLSLNEQIQFWTTRGFAVADVNYRGSTGFGRAYRESLHGKWGVYDVADCVAVANYLVAENKVHPQQLIIRGKSAGGYSVLAALCFHDVFTIGSVHYGISDLTMLAEDTHKFEARYLDKLIAPYPEGKQIYIDRSPINHLSQMNNPVIVFQGLLDKVVPPSQAEAIVDALKKKGIDVEYVTFADEKHGFRQARNIKKAFAEELKFYLKHINQCY